MPTISALTNIPVRNCIWISVEFSIKEDLQTSAGPKLFDPLDFADLFF